MKILLRLCLILIALTALNGLVLAQSISLMPRLIALQVHDLDVSRDWYKKHLDFEVEKEMDFKDYKLRIALMKHDKFKLELVDNENSFYIKDVAPDVGDNKPAIGFAKLTFEVKEIERVYDRLKKAGAKIQYELTISNTDASEKWFMIQDPDGNSIQLIGK